ncbi:PREDICTED: uncharacterized protein LOC108548044 [Eufriesea mexicana]|uniref:uncharacterized protein LOC108548044 n=1 Tax=Eufriesea mexicana TaxID=516756 RepID=UPI00083C105B|nr:PREDICTED: uncharacterized protein LOC108548044 [Eufriesea mexicana]
MKMKEQESKKMSGKWSDSKLQSENSNVTQKPVSTCDQEKTKSAIASKKNSCCLNAKKQTTSTANTLNSFEPEIICESEERERVTALAQRDFLIKSYGMLEQIYMAMKKNGTLRAIDEKKYGLYGRLAYTDNISKSASSCRHRCHVHQHSEAETRYVPWANQSSQFCLKASKVDNLT